MAGLSISGLSSGIDTASVISSLIAVAAAPQNQLKTQLSTQQRKLTDYQSINAKLSALQTAASALADPGTWGATVAASSDPSVVATGSSAALSGTTTTLTVNQLAQSQVSTDRPSDPTNAANSGNGLSVTIGGKTTAVSLSGNTAADVVSAVNAANLGLRASLITTSTGGTVIQFASTGQGAASAFTISGLNDSMSTLRPAQDALVTVGDPTAGGYSVSSSTNTFTNAIAGVTFSVGKAGVTTTIGVTSDQSAITTAVQNLVNAANDAVSTIGSYTGQGGDLAAQFGVTSLAQSLLSAVSHGASTGQDYGAFGISLDSAGKLSFNAATFATAYNQNPTGVQSALQTGLAGGFSTITTAASDTNSGVVGSAITAENTQISSLNTQIATWDTKLSSMKDSLTQRYAAMEAALSKMKSESSYLTTQFNALNGTSSTSSSSSSR